MKVALVLNQLRDGDVPDHMVPLELAAIMRGCQERLVSVQPNWLRRTLAIASRYRRNLCQTAMRNAAAARRARAIGVPALRSAACFPRASAARALGPLPCARRTSLSSAHARPSQCGVRGNSSSFTKMRFVTAGMGCPIRQQARLRNAHGSGVRLHASRRYAFARFKRFGQRLNHGVIPSGRLLNLALETFLR